MFAYIKLFFTDRGRFESRRRYLKLQRTMRKQLKKHAKEFCPWSGWYMHEMVKLMLEFYYKTYEAGDCCCSVEERVQRNASSLKEVLDYVEKLAATDFASSAELIEEARAYEDFAIFCAQMTEDMGSTYDKLSEDIKGYTAYEFLEKKYTSKIYSLIGEHIWEWCD
jgi:hypothetical protein